MITFECSSCSAKLQVKDEHAGKSIQCPTCKTKTTAPSLKDALPAGPVEASATDVTTPENVKPKAARRVSQEGDALEPPRRRDTEKPVAGIGIGAILLIVLGVFGCCFLSFTALIVGLTLPAINKVNQAAAQTQSVNNLKQIGLAMQSFHDTNKRVPFNGIAPGAKFTAPGSVITYHGNAVTDMSSSGSWLFQIAPYCDQQAIFHLSGKADNDTVPEHFKNIGVSTFLCPGRGRPQFESGKGPWSDYFINNYVNTSGNQTSSDKPDNQDVKRTLIGITDGSSNTIFAGHGFISTNDYRRSTAVFGSSNIFTGGTQGTMRGGPKATQPWIGPNVTMQRDGLNAINLTSGGWGGPFPNGALMAWCDATVRMVPYSTNPNVLGAYLTPTNGETVTLPD